MKNKLVLASIGVFVIIAIGGYWYWSTTPKYSLNKIKSSIENHDVPTFEKHVNVESISSRFIDDMLEEVNKEMESEGEAEQFGNALGQGFLQMMKPRLINLIEERIIRFVEKGSIPETNNEELEGTGLNNLTDEIGIGEDLFKGIEYVNKKGKTAYIGLSFDHATYDTTLTLELLMRDMGSYWQVSELSNIPELSAKIDAIEAEKLNRINSETANEIANTLLINSIEKVNESSGYSRNMKVSLSLENISSEVIDGFKVSIDALDNESQLIKTIIVESNMRIEPNSVHNEAWNVDVNMFEESSIELFEMSNDDINYNSEILEVSFLNGDQLKIYESMSEYNFGI